VLLLLLPVLSWAVRPVDCATAHTYRPVQAPVPAPPPPPDGKGERDTLELPGLATSEHFALRWGPDLDPDPADTQATLDLLEDAWALEVNDWGHTPPYGSEEYLFNVYLGGTGGNAPSTLGAAGYYTLDNQDWPMLVLDPALLDDDPDYLAMTVAHEFFHAVQGATDRYAWDGSVGSWFWESTATWASYKAYPQVDDHAEFLFGYALLPQEPVDAFADFQTGALIEYYSYGAFLFIRDIDDLSQGNLIRRAWEDPTDEPDPLVVLDGLLQEQLRSIDQVWIQHSAQLAVWSYPEGETYERLVAAEFDRPEQADRVAGRLRGTGSDSFVPPVRLQPRRYGFNVVEIDPPPPDNARVTLTLNGVPMGSTGSVPVWHMMLIEHDESDDMLLFRQVESGPQPTVSWTSSGGPVQVVVGPTSPRGQDWRTETFGYELSVVVVPDEPPDEGRGGQGCGCTAVDGAGGLAWLAAPLGLVLGRRRSRRSGRSEGSRSC